MTAFFETFLHAPWMLAGLAVLVIPPLVHLLNRRRFDVVDWGAMQFLQVSQSNRRRFFLEELLLMLLRVGLLALLVVGLAGPFFDTTSAGTLAAAPRDTVLLLDGSASMAVREPGSAGAPFERALAWARGYLDRRAPGDQVAVLLVRDRVVPLAAPLTPDLQRVRAALADPPPPAGGSDWPDALRQAYKLLATSQKARREILVLRDNQKALWADPDTLFRWELLRSDLGLDQEARPGRPALRVIDFSPNRTADLPNYSLTSLVASRPVVPVDREVSFRSTLNVTGRATGEAPYRIRFEVDGKHVRDLRGSGKGQLSCAHRFSKPGTHLVSLVVEPDLPPGDRPPGYAVRDCVPDDNRQDIVVDVVKAIGVLIVDGSPSTTSEHGSGFLRDALAPARDPEPSVRVRAISPAAFTPALLLNDPPGVVILHDVPSLQPAQAEAAGAFLSAGGGLLVSLGGRAEAAYYNDHLYRGGAGWLPARLDGVSSQEARPDPAAVSHPILEVFARDESGGFWDARFPRWMRLVLPEQNSRASPIGQLLGAAGKYPFMAERRLGSGKVIVSAVPLDASWGANLVDLPAFVPLVHETVYYLAGARSGQFNLRPGQPFRMRVGSDVSVDAFRLSPPQGPTLPLSARPDQPKTYPAAVVSGEGGPVVVIDRTQTPGVYRLHPPAGEPVTFVVGSDPREADLRPCSAEDRDRVYQILSASALEPDAAETQESGPATTRRSELWWYVLLGLLGFLLLEVWLTRRLVRNR